MKKTLVVTLATVAAAAVAVPAFAKDHSITGMFRARAIAADLSLTRDSNPDLLVDQRFRARWDMKLNEWVSTTYFGEIDFQWGDRSYTTSRNEGGGIGGDATNLETKQLYLDAKIPKTPVSARVGLQGAADRYDFALFLFDAAGVSLSAKTDMVTGTLAWYKLAEEFVETAGATQGNVNTSNSPTNARQDDDVDFYTLSLGFKPMGALNLGADLYYLRNLKGVIPAFSAANANNTAGISLNGAGSREDLYYLGVNVGYKLPMGNLTGWALYGFGTQANAGTPAGNDRDVGGYALSAKGTFSLAGANLGLRGLYFSGDDNDTDNDVDSFRQPFSGAAAEALAFAGDGLMIMTGDSMQTTYPGTARTIPGFAMADAAYAGFGLTGAILSGSYVPPAAKDAYVRASLGYFAALEDDRNLGVAATKDRRGKSLGTEIAVRIGYKLSGAVDVSLNGAYAFLGDFYDGMVNETNNTAIAPTAERRATGNDPDNPFLTYLMASVNF